MAKKKILVIGMTSLIGGVETYIFNVVKYINKNKYDFDFLLIGQDKRSVFESEINEMMGDGKDHFHYAPNMKSSYKKSNRWLKDFYDSHHYDAIYMNATTAARFMYCRYAVNKLGVKLITHSHSGNAISTLRGASSRLFRHYVTKHSWLKLACSEKAYYWMFDDEMQDNVIIPNGIDTNKFHFNQTNRESIRAELGISDDKIVIGHVGRWASPKNQIYFVSLSKSLGDRYIFLCLGDGPDKEPFFKKVEEEGIENRFIIFNARNDVYRYYSAMDVFAMPSHYEGLPIVAVEAQCNGLSCVLSDKISKQTNISGKCEFVPIEDLGKWVNTVISIDKNRFDGEKSLKEHGFSIESTAKMVENFFDKI